MRVVMYMAVTADGFIARENDETDFVSKAEWQSFQETVRDYGNLVTGRRTYEVMLKQDEFAGLGDIIACVVTSKEGFQPENPRHVAAPSPARALEFLKSSGFSDVFLSGGGELNASFLREGLVDEVYLDVEPALLGKGIRLLGEDGAEAKLALLGSKNLSPDTIQLHYKVLKS